MDERIKKEESAPKSEEFSSAPGKEVLEQQEDIAQKYTPTQMAQARQKYIKGRKEEIEILEVDVRFLRLQVEHYNLTRQIGNINEEIKEAKKLADSKDFAKNIAI